VQCTYLVILRTAQTSVTDVQVLVLSGCMLAKLQLRHRPGHGLDFWAEKKLQTWSPTFFCSDHVGVMEFGHNWVNMWVKCLLVLHGNGIHVDLSHVMVESTESNFFSDYVVLCIISMFLPVVVLFSYCDCWLFDWLTGQSAVRPWHVERSLKS